MQIIHRMYNKVALLLLLIIAVSTQDCLNNEGVAVDWWAILKVPPKVGSSGFGYFDSTYTLSQFKYSPLHVDSKSALTLTLLQINSQNLQTVAWNDEKPTGQTSTTLAHSKSVIAYSKTTKKGYLLNHSLPKYPAFIDKLVNITIGDPQNYYGQHLLCISMPLTELNKLASHLVITRPYVYQRNVQNTTQTHYLSDLAESKSLKVAEHFQTQQFNPSSKSNIKAIFKNGFENCSIFEDGLTNYLKTSLIAESWGRPIQKSWCSRPYTVTNVQSMVVGQVTWGEQDDHSKWALAGNQYVCFGDMNRMQTQWKRGGSFYCVNSFPLATAIRRTILSADTC